MYDNTRTYFIENVLIPFQEYLKLKQKNKLGLSIHLRSAINTASNLYHLREHLPNNIDLSRKKLSIICPDYDLLGDVVNASKHKIINNNNPQISNSKNIYEVMIFTEYEDKEGKYFNLENCVYIKLDSGKERNLHEVIINVMNMWLNKLVELQLIDPVKRYEYKSNRIPKRKKDYSTTILAMQKLRFAPILKLQKYNYESKTIEPQNLTGTKIEWNVYEPQIILELKITEKSGIEHNLEIPVSKEQKIKIEKMKEDDLKYQYLIELAIDKKIIRFDDPK